MRPLFGSDEHHPINREARRPLSTLCCYATLHDGWELQGLAHKGERQDQHNTESQEDADARQGIAKELHSEPSAWQYSSFRIPIKIRAECVSPLTDHQGCRLSTHSAH